MQLKRLTKINLKALSFSLLAVTIISLSTILVYNAINVPAYAQQANAWNLQKQTSPATNNLNFTYSTSGFPTALTVTPAGNIGIGTTTPPAPISLGPTVLAQKLLIWESGNTRYGLGIQSGEMRVFVPNVAGNGLTFGTVNSTDGSTYVEAMRILNNNVGIGATAPADSLEIAKPAGTRASMRFHQISSGEGTIGIKASDSTFYMTNTIGLGPVGLGTPATSIALTAAGNVGMGIAAPIAKLDVRGVGAINGGNLFGSANNFLTSGALNIGNSAIGYGGGSGWTTNTAGLLMETANNTEIAIHDAGHRIASLMYYQGDAQDTNGRITIGRNMGWASIGKIVLNGPTDCLPSCTNGSDFRIKKNITPISDPLNKILALDGVGYEYNSDNIFKLNLPPGKQIGLIAQEVEKIVPEVVSTDSINGFKSLSYQNLVALLVEGIKDQQTQINTLKQQIEEAKTQKTGQDEKIQHLEVQLNALTEKVNNLNN